MVSSAAARYIYSYPVLVLLALYVTCVIGILLDSFWLVPLIIHMAILMTESRMMGLRFAGCLCGFPGLWRGTSIHSFSSSGYSPDLDVVEYFCNSSVDDLCTVIQ